MKEAKFISGQWPPNNLETRIHLENKHHYSCVTRTQNSFPKYLTQLPVVFLLSLPQKKRLSSYIGKNFFGFFFFFVFREKANNSFYPRHLLRLTSHNADKHSLKYKLINPGRVITFILIQRLPNSVMWCNQHPKLKIVLWQHMVYPTEAGRQDAPNDKRVRFPASPSSLARWGDRHALHRIRGGKEKKNKIKLQ